MIIPLDVKAVSRKSFSRYKEDLNFLNTKFSLIGGFYARNQTEVNTEWTGREPIVTNENIKDVFNRSFGYNVPFIDNRLYSIIAKNGSKPTPKGIRIPGRSEVETSDIECCKRYGTRSRLARSNVFDYLSYCGISASYAIGVFYSSDNRTDQREVVEFSVMSTAKNTNSGFPFFKRKDSKRCISDTIVWVNDFLNRPTLYGLFKNPAVIFHRFQPKVYPKDRFIDTAIRQVWCIPQRVIALEQYFFGHILDSVKMFSKSNSDPNYITGLTNSEISEKAVRRVKELIVANPFMSNKLVSLDYSKYDSTIPDFSYDIFFTIMENFIVFRSEKEKSAYSLLRKYSKFTPYVYNSEMNMQLRGMNSGSLLTNMFDTWFNLTLLIAAHNVVEKNPQLAHFLARGDIDFIKYPQYDGIMEYLFYPDRMISTRGIKVCGDDVLMFANDLIVEVHSKICSSMGMSVKTNLESRTVFEDVFFLGRYWNKNCEPFQDDFYITAHLIFRTKWYQDKDEVGFELTSNNIEFNRILSICCPLVNGYDYIQEVFSSWKQFINFIKFRYSFTDLRDNQEFQLRLVSSMLNWSLF